MKNTKNKIKDSLDGIQKVFSIGGALVTIILALCTLYNRLVAVEGALQRRKENIQDLYNKFDSLGMNKAKCHIALLQLKSENQSAKIDYTLCDEIKN